MKRFLLVVFAVIMLFSGNAFAKVDGWEGPGFYMVGGGGTNVHYYSENPNNPNITFVGGVGEGGAGDAEAYAKAQANAVANAKAIANQKQNQEQNQGQIQGQSTDVDVKQANKQETKVDVKVEADKTREFIPGPMLPPTALTVYTGPNASLYAKMYPWKDKKEWTREEVKQMTGCYFCTIDKSFIKKLPAVDKITNCRSDETGYLGSEILKGNPLELRTQLLDDGMNAGANCYDVTAREVKFKNASGGVSINLGGTISTIPGSGNEAYSAASGIGGGYAAASQIEWLEIEVKYFKADPNKVVTATLDANEKPVPAAKTEAKKTKK